MRLARRAAALAFAAAMLMPNPAPAAETGAPGRILVDSATYGASCGQKDSNATESLRRLCDGLPRCEIALDAAALIGADPAPACDKDLEVSWSCNGSLPGRNTLHVMPETGLAILACAAVGEPGADVAQSEPPAAETAQPPEPTPPEALPDAPPADALPATDAPPADAPPADAPPADAPPGGVRLRIDAATYGGNCGAPAGNATRLLSEACDGRDACSYIADRAVLGDPAPGCAKNLVVEWSCPGEAAGTRIFEAAPEAGLGSIVALTCPVSDAAAAEAPPAAPARPCDGSFNGTWATNLGAIDLVVAGEAVTGSYAGGGSIEGTVSGRVLDGQWSDAQGTGTLQLTLEGDGRRFEGTWSRDSGKTGVWHGSCLTPPSPEAPAMGVTEGPIRGFAWIGADADFVGAADMAQDGALDGHFRLDLVIGYPAQEIRSITVRSSDAVGGAFGDLAWDTADPQRRPLGVVFKGKPLLQAARPSLGAFQGSFPLDLYVAGPERLEPGQHVAVEVTAGDGTLYRKLGQIGPSELQGETSRAGTGAALEPDTDRPGGDFMDFVMPQPEPMLCRAACLAAPSCQAWTFVKPGLSGPQAHCWLKSSVPEPVERDCCVSGVVGD